MEQKKTPGEPSKWHLQSGPEGGIVNINDTTILEMAKKIIVQTERSAPQTSS